MPSTDAHTATIRWLNHLRNLLHHSVQGYQQAIKMMDNERLITKLKHMAFDYEQQALALDRLIIAHGGEVEKSNQVAQSFLHGWMDIKAALMPNRVLAAIEEVDADTINLLECYRDAINAEELDEAIHNVLRGQYQTIDDHAKQIHALRNALDDTTTQEIEAELRAGLPADPDAAQEEQQNGSRDDANSPDGKV